MKQFKIIDIRDSEDQNNSDIVKRLYDMGLYPSLEVCVVNKISFNSVFIIQYGNTRLALNEEEFQCLRGH